MFADGAERAWLEALIHPLVRARFDADLARLAAAPVVVLMIPLLFEAGLEGLCSEVWLVDCEEGQQLKRLMARDRLSEAEARARVATQWPLERKRQLADLVIDNQGAATSLAERVKEALEAQTPSRAETTRSTQASGPAPVNHPSGHRSTGDPMMFSTRRFQGADGLRIRLPGPWEHWQVITSHLEDGHVMSLFGNTYMLRMRPLTLPIACNPPPKRHCAN